MCIKDRVKPWVVGKKVIRSLKGSTTGIVHPFRATMPERQPRALPGLIEYCLSSNAVVADK